MKKQYVLAVTKDFAGYYEEVHFTNSEAGLAHKNAVLEQYGNDSVVFYYTTTCLGDYLKYRVKVLCFVLREEVIRHNELLTFHKGSPILDETYTLCAARQETMCEIIGRVMSRYQNWCVKYDREMDINDEIALKCLDIRNAKLIENTLRDDLDRKFNRRYYQSQMNAYC